MLSLATFLVIGEGNAPQEATAICVTDEPTIYYVRTFNWPQGTIHNITGLCAPVGSTVYLSSGFIENNVPSLTENVELQVDTDESGYFSFSGIDGGDDTIAVWIRVGSEHAQTAYILCDDVSANTDAQNARLVKTSFTVDRNVVCGNCDGDGHVNDTCTVCGGTGKLSDGSVCQTCKCTACGGSGHVTGEQLEYTFTGYATPDISTIYFSYCMDGDDVDAMDINDLNNNLIASTENDVSSPSSISQSFEVEGVIVNHDTLVAWGLTTESTGSSINLTGSTCTNADVECLSGDTLILLCDGSVRRLDELSEGDEVMSENLTPTRVNTLARGHFNTYHTLYRFEDGSIIDETHAHRFYNVEQGFWQRLGNWKIGEHAISQNGSHIALISVERIAESVEMFGIWTESGSYYANGLLSGDASCNQPLLAEATAEQTVDMMLSMEEYKLLSLIGLEGILP